jgi:hypothetical protein
MIDEAIDEHEPVEVIVRAAYRRSTGPPPAANGGRRAAEDVFLALAETQLDRVADHGFDPEAAAALDTLRRYLTGDAELGEAHSSTILRPDHHGGWACRIDAPMTIAFAQTLDSIARAFRGNRRFAAIALEVVPWMRSSASTPTPIDTTLGDRVIMLDREGDGIEDLRDTSRICAALRLAIMKRCPIQPVPEWIGGHREDGEALERDHLACITLPQPTATGAWRLAAAALLVPRDVSDAEVRRDLLPAIEPGRGLGPLRLWDSRTPAISWSLRPRCGGAAESTLRESWWRGGDRGAARWASLTPVVMDRHGSRARERREAIERSCRRLGLPAPIAVELGRDSAVPGVPAAGSFPMMRRAGRHPRQQWHVEVTFDRPVRGPIVLGAGRYRGYGLMMPLAPAGEDADRDG